MGCVTSRKENLKKYSSKNLIIKTQGTMRKILTIKISRTVKHKKGLYIVSEAAASQEFSNRNSLNNQVKLYVSKQDTKYTTI